MTHPVEREIDRSRRRLETLREHARGVRSGAETPLAEETAEELGHALEELSIALDELTATSQRLAEAQQVAQEHARRYLDLFRFAPDPCLVTDAQGVIREVNAASEDKLGRRGHHLAGKSLLTLVADADRDAFLECLAALRDRGVRISDQLLGFGSPRHLEALVSAAPHRRDDGLEIRWMLRDVTDSRRTERALQTSEARMRTLAQSVRVLISYVDREQRYRFTNEAYERWFGIPFEQLEGMTVRELIGEESYRKVQPHIERALAGEAQFFEQQIPIGGGPVRDVVVEYEPDARAGGEVEGFYALVTDVSPLRRAEQDAREAEERTQAVLDAALDGILSADETGTIRSVNPALCRMLGLGREELVGRRVEEILALPQGQQGRVSLADLAGTVCELVGVSPERPDLPVQVSVGEVRLDGPTFVATVRDLSGQRSLESQLREAASAATVAEDRERRRLASDLHDDVSQLLTLAGMKLGLLRDRTIGTALKEDLREVEGLVSRAHARTESLTFQLSPPILHDVGLRAAAEWLAEEMGRNYGLRVHLEADGDPPLDEAVRVTLFRALRELLINVARHAGTNEARVRVRQEEDCVRIVVEDEGVGFDTENAPPGYGLFSIRERLRHLNGRLDIEAVPGNGTRVTLTAPREGERRGDPPTP